MATDPALIEQLSGFRAPESIIDGDFTDPGARPRRASGPTDEELAHPIVAPGEEALLPCGILYQAGWEPLGDGMARHARAQVRALARTGLPVSLRSLPIARMMLDEEIDPRVIAEVGHIRNTSIGSAPFAIRQLVIHGLNFLENVICPAGARLSGFDNELEVYRSTIVYTSWERTTVDPEVVEVLNRCAEVWVPCNQNYDAFRKAGVKKVHVIPCPYDPNTNLCAQIPAPRGSERVPNGLRFYAIGKWEPRKNYHALIGAFLREFSPDEKASLFIKTTEWGAWKDYLSVKDSIAFWLADEGVRTYGWTEEKFRQRVRVSAGGKVTDEQIAKLHRENNIYVTCSHGEAWDLPAFDAKCAGNRLVYTGFGGADDYAGENDVGILDWKNVPLEPVHPGYGWEPNAEWASVPCDRISTALRAARPPVRRVHPPEFCREYGMAAVGRRMAARLESLSHDAYEELTLTGGFG